MIRALRACLARADLRRLVGIVVLIAFVAVLVHGAAHQVGVADGDHHHHDDCAACSAASCTFAFELVETPQLVLHLGDRGPVATASPAVPPAAEPTYVHAPRGPPSRA